MKRLILSAALIVAATTAAHAQFHEGTKYIATSVTGLNMSYSKSSEFNFGLNAEGGYYFADAWMAHANLGINHAKTLSGFNLGAGVRYSFLQNGIFIGAGLEYAFDRYSTTMQVKHENTINYLTPMLDENNLPVLDVNGQVIMVPYGDASHTELITNVKSRENVHNIRIPIEIGYTFYLNHFLAIEPAVYSKMSLNHFSEGSEFGLKVGLGFYFDRFHNVRNTHYRSGSYDSFTF